MLTMKRLLNVWLWFETGEGSGGIGMPLQLSHAVNIQTYGLSAILKVNSSRWPTFGFVPHVFANFKEVKGIASTVYIYIYYIYVYIYIVYSIFPLDTLLKYKLWTNEPCTYRKKAWPCVGCQHKTSSRYVRCKWNF